MHCAPSTVHLIKHHALIILYQASSSKHCVPSIEHQASYTKHLAPNIVQEVLCTKYPAPSIPHPSIVHQTPWSCTKHRDPSILHQASYTNNCAPSIRHQASCTECMCMVGYVDYIYLRGFLLRIKQEMFGIMLFTQLFPITDEERESIAFFSPGFVP